MKKGSSTTPLNTLVSSADAELMLSVWEGYSENSARHLLALSRYLQTRLMTVLSEDCGYSGLQLSYEPYITVLASGRLDGGQGDKQGEKDLGVRPTDLADYLGISKQACNQTLNQLQQYGYVARKADPSDGRSKRLFLTKQGLSLARDGALVLDQIEQEFSKALGLKRVSASFLESLSESLLQLVLGLDLSESQRDWGNLGADQKLGAFLPLLGRYINQRLMTLTRAKGHPNIALGHGQVLTLIGPTGGRIQLMAAIQNVSKQSISATVVELVELGYLEKSVEQGDARLVKVSFTVRGWQLIRDSIDSVVLLEQEFAQVLGSAKQLSALILQLSQLYHALGLEDDVFPDRHLAGSVNSKSKQVSAEVNVKLLAKNLHRQLSRKKLAELVDLLSAQ